MLFRGEINFGEELEKLQPTSSVVVVEDSNVEESTPTNVVDSSVVESDFLESSWDGFSDDHSPKKQTADLVSDSNSTSLPIPSSSTEPLASLQPETQTTTPTTSSMRTIKLKSGASKRGLGAKRMSKEMSSKASTVDISKVGTIKEEPVLHTAEIRSSSFEDNSSSATTLFSTHQSWEVKTKTEPRDKFANARSISSADYFAAASSNYTQPETQPSDVSFRFAGARSISSSEYFGEDAPVTPRSPRRNETSDELRELASQFIKKASLEASEMKAVAGKALKQVSSYLDDFLSKGYQ